MTNDPETKERLLKPAEEADVAELSRYRRLANQFTHGVRQIVSSALDTINPDHGHIFELPESPHKPKKRANSKPMSEVKPVRSIFEDEPSLYRRTGSDRREKERRKIQTFSTGSERRIRIRDRRKIERRKPKKKKTPCG